MIYITFFIVILISKRGVREALREREKTNTEYKYQYRYRYEYRYEYRAYTEAPPPREKGMSGKRYEPPRLHHAYTATPHRLEIETEREKRGMQQHRHTTPHRLHSTAHRLQERAPARTHRRARLHTRLHTGAQAPTGAHRRGLGERHPSVTTPETTCDHSPLHPP